MKTFQSWFFRILWWLTFVVVFLVIIVLANRQWIVRQMVERQIRTATGMEPEIGDLTFNVSDPNVTLTNFKLYNPAEFGGTVFLDVPELHIEYDRAALRRSEFHFKLVRVNLREVDVVKNEAGATNLMSVVNALAPRKSGGGGRTFAPLNGFNFTGIDVLNLSIGTAKFVDLKDQHRNRMVAINLQNKIYTNVVTSANLPGLSGLLWQRGGNLVGLPVNPPAHIDILQSVTNAPAP